MINFVHGQLWQHASGGYFAWYLTELIGFVALPMVLFLTAAAHGSGGLIRIASLLTLLGIVINRLNISVIAFKWYESNHYVPHWMEIVVTAAIISAEIWVFRWVVRRLPVLSSSPAWAREDHAAESAGGA